MTSFMNQSTVIEELRRELAKLQLDYQVLEKSHRRLVAKVLTDRVEAEHFTGQMAVDRTILNSTALKPIK